MSESRGVAHVEHHREGFIRHYIFSTDHKMIGRQFLFGGLFMLVIGGLLAMMVRWQLGFPGTPLPLTGLVPDEFWENQNWLPSMRVGVISSEVYNMLFTMHATIMIFFVVMPIMVGGFGNFLIPISIGANDMAFPTLNMLSFWTAVPAFILLIISFFVPGGAAGGGWTSYAPLAAVPKYAQTGGEWGVHLWCISLFILGFSSLMGSINYITTLINMRAPGMTWFRLPLVIWSLFIVAVLLLLALPVLTSALAMLLFDRMFGTHFFIPEGGGEPLLWGKITFPPPMLFALGFVSLFTIGGLSGIFMASTPVDIFIHDTYYIVAHIHYVVAGIIFGVFAGLYFWFPKIFGRMMNEKLGKIHFWFTFVFFNLTFFPMHFLGVGGHMRRIYNPTDYKFLEPFYGMNPFINV